MSEQHSYDVAVIGGGIMGASTALFLRQRGLRVTLVVYADRGATQRSCRCPCARMRCGDNCLP